MKYILTLISILILSSCSVYKNNVIQTNQFVQTNYDFNCLGDNKTLSEIILCYQEQDKAEKLQNNITNKLLEVK